MTDTPTNDFPPLRHPALRFETRPLTDEDIDGIITWIPEDAELRHAKACEYVRKFIELVDSRQLFGANSMLLHAKAMADIPLRGAIEDPAKYGVDAERFNAALAYHTEHYKITDVLSRLPKYKS